MSSRKILNILISTSCFYKKRNIMSASEELGGLLNKLNKYNVYMASHQTNIALKVVDYLFFFARYGVIGNISIVDLNSGRQSLWALISLCASKIFNIKTILVVHGGKFTEMASSHPRYIRFLLLMSDSIITPSLSINEYINNNIGFQCIQIPNGINYSLYCNERKTVEPKFLYVRGYNKIYNPLMAIMAFHLILKELPNSTLTMCGVVSDKDLYNKCIEFARKNNLDKHVTINSQVDKKSMPQLMNRHSFLLNTTNYESFGVSVLEGCASGLCVITTNAGDLPMIWNNAEHVIFVNTEDYQKMAEQSISLYNDKSRVLEICERASNKAKEFDYVDVIQRYQNIIDKLNTGCENDES